MFCYHVHILVYTIIILFNIYILNNHTYIQLIKLQYPKYSNHITTDLYTNIMNSQSQLPGK